MFPENDPLIGKQIGNYVVVELLAKGGMGSVYLGRHPEIGRQVAIKVLFRSLTGEQGFTERFVAEARVLARLDHPNIIQIFDFGRTDDEQLYYVMELLQGGDLAEYLNEAGQLPAQTAWPVLQQICSALQTAHDHGIIHRDLKLENIFIRRRDPVVVKLLDFGIAKVLQGTKQWHTSTGMVIGTPVFMAPEQAAGKADKICIQTDVYALGVMMHLLLTGEPPFWADTAPELLVKHLHEQPPPLVSGDPNQPPGLAELAERCLAKKTRHRPSSAREVALAFADAIGAEVTDPVLLEREPSVVIAPGNIKASGTDATLPATPAMYEKRQPTDQTNKGGRKRRAGRTGPPTKVNTISTLSSSVGELWSEEVMRPHRARRWIVVGAVVGALTAGGLLLQHVANEDIPTATPEPIATGVSATPLPPSDGSQQAQPQKHVIQVRLADGVIATDAPSCTYRIDDGEQRSSPLPCQISVAHGVRIALDLSGRSAEARQLVVIKDSVLDVRRTKQGWAFTDDEITGDVDSISSPAKHTHVVLKKAKKATRPRARKRHRKRSRNRARVKKAAPQTPSTAKKVPKNKVPKKVPKKVGAGTMEF